LNFQGTPEAAKSISVPVLFSPLFLLQGVGVLFAASKLIEKVVLLLRGEDDTGLYFRFLSRAHDCLGFLHHGSRLLGWWSIDEGSREEEARLYFDQESGYNTFCGHPPEIVKKMPKKELAEEVWRLQAALGEQTEITKFSQQEYERLQNVMLSPLLLINYTSQGLAFTPFLFWCCFSFGLNFISRCSLCSRRKCCVGYVLKEKSVLYCFHVDTVFSAETVQTSVKNAPSAV
jgi:hypothetical protein